MTRDAGAATGVPPALLASIAWQESSWQTNPDHGPRWIDELGILQIRPATARWLGYTGPLDALVTDPALSFHLGALYLSQLRARFGGWPEAISAFNAGHPISGNIQGYVLPILQRANAWAKSPTGKVSLVGLAAALGLLLVLLRRR